MDAEGKPEPYCSNLIPSFLFKTRQKGGGLLKTFIFEVESKIRRGQNSEGCHESAKCEKGELGSKNSKLSRHKLHHWLGECRHDYSVWRVSL
jgi:hypothetical protein